MRPKATLISALCLAIPTLMYAVAAAQPEPMKPVDKDRHRIDEGRGHDAGRDRSRGPAEFGPQGRRPRDLNDGQWILGLTGDDTDIGVRVRNVVAGTPAAQAGFEPDDIIVNVGGYQVGILDGRRFDLGDELQRQAGRDGRVTLLIQNRRDRRLQNVPVQLQWQQNRWAVTGTIDYRERIALPPDAVCFVELIETDFRGRMLRVVQKQLVRMGDAPSVAFELPYERREIDPSRRYAVQARIESGGRVWLETQDTYYVLTQGGPDRIDLILRGRNVPSGPRRP